MNTRVQRHDNINRRKTNRPDGRPGDFCVGYELRIDQIPLELGHIEDTARTITIKVGVIANLSPLKGKIERIVFGVLSDTRFTALDDRSVDDRQFSVMVKIADLSTVVDLIKGF